MPWPLGQACVTSQLWISGWSLCCPFATTKDQWDQWAAFGGTSYWECSKRFGRIYDQSLTAWLYQSVTGEGAEK